MNKKFLIGVNIYFAVLVAFSSFFDVVGLPDQELPNNEMGEKMLLNSSNLSQKQFKIFGFGFVSNIGVLNSLWRFITYKSNNSLQGIFYKANISFTNQNDIQVHGYCIFIKDVNSGIIYTKKLLPMRFHIYNFTGFVSLYYYYIPHGGGGCGFQLLGKADDFQAFT